MQEKIKNYWNFEKVTRIIELILLTAGLVLAYMGVGKFFNFVDITAQSIKAKDAAFEQFKVINPGGEGLKIVPSATTSLEFIGGE